MRQRYSIVCNCDVQHVHVLTRCMCERSDVASSQVDEAEHSTLSFPESFGQAKEKCGSHTVSIFFSADVATRV
jgi:hypothetical protein